MTQELTILALAGLLQTLQLCLFSVLTNLQVPTKVTAGPRDTPIELTGYAGRARRALNNHFEGLILFTLAVVVVTLSDQSTPLTQNAAWAYLIARVLYVPAYLIGKGLWRSLIWSVGFMATIVMIISTLI